MPNWAITEYAIEGPKETLQKIEQAILHHDTEEGSSKDWEGNVLNALGINWVRRDLDRMIGLYMRGFIHDGPWWIKDYTVLRFYAEEAWGATDFHIALESALPVKVFYSVEEEGEGIYATNDKKGKYFDSKFYVDTCVNGNYQSEYFKTKKAAYAWISKLTEGKVKTEKDVEAFNDNVDGNSEDFIYIHKYAIV